MKTLTKEGQKKIDDIAARYELSKDSVLSMLDAVIKGNATMAQFNHCIQHGQNAVFA